MTDRLTLPRRHRAQLETLLREYLPDVEVWAYGSRVSGECHEGSDLDLVLRGPNLQPLGNDFHDLRKAIERSNIPILVQIHDWAGLPEVFHREIERDYVVVQYGGDEQGVWDGGAGAAAKSREGGKAGMVGRVADVDVVELGDE